MPRTSTDAAHRAAERAARDSYGRLLAWLAYRWRDLAAAEDALADALLAALTHWPTRGVPDSPDAWLLAVAKRNLLQVHRHRQVVDAHALREWLDHEPSPSSTPVVPDDRLKLLFVCAHPAIDATVRTPLMLQTVFGLDAARIAAPFLVAPATMAQRLVRAKSKIRDAAIRYEEPEAEALPERLHAVLEAIYAAYGTGWDAAFALPTGMGPAAPAAEDEGFTGEALYLAALVAQLLPAAAEAHGLLALLMFCESRRAAHVDEDGRFVPLMAQDTRRWDLERIRAADDLLWRAARLGEPGPFQLEAAIQSAHCQRAFRESTPWEAIAALYAALAAMAPSVGTAVGQAVAVGEAGDVARGLALLDAIDPQRVSTYQPYWVGRAHLLTLAERPAEARECYERAIGLTSQRSLTAHLRARQSALRTA